MQPLQWAGHVLSDCVMDTFTMGSCCLHYLCAATTATPVTTKAPATSTPVTTQSPATTKLPATTATGE